MGNPFDQFDPVPAGNAQSLATLRGGASNPFDAFDRSDGAGAGASPQAAPDDDPGPLVVTVRAGRPKVGPIEVDPHDPDAAQRAYETLTGTRQDTMTADGQPSTNESFVRGARQGIGLNFADEARGVAEASGLPSWLPGAQLVGGARLIGERFAPGLFGHDATDRYDRTVSQERASDDAAREANPGTFLTGELAGGVAGAGVMPMLAPFRAAEGAGIVARGANAAGNLAATGAAYGGIAGAGGGEGSLAERAGPAAEGAAIGAALTPALGGALGAARGVGRFVGDHIAASHAPGTVADRMVAKNLKRDSANPAALADDIERAGTVGQDLTLADVAGPNTQGVVGSIARTPGDGRAPARQFLEDRQIGTETAPGQGERISDRIARVMGDDSSIGTADSIIASRAEKAAPAYETAFRKPIDYNSPAGQNLDGMLEQIPNSARARANELLRLEDKSGEQMVFGHVPDRNGMYPIRAVPNTRQWDYIRRALWDDALGSKGFGKEGDVSQYGSAVRQLIGRVDEQLNTAVPALKTARSIYKGESDLLDALRVGRTAFHPSTSPEVVERTLAAMTPGEQALYRLGAGNALRGNLANYADGVSKVRAAFGNPAVRAKVLAMMRADPKGHAEFVRYLGNEGAMYATRGKALSGSPTAERLGEDADTARSVADGAHAVMKLVHGHIGPALGAAFRHMAKINPELRGRVLDEARKIILNPDPEAVRAFVARVKASEMKEGTAQRVIAAITAALPRTVAAEAARAR